VIGLSQFVQSLQNLNPPLKADRAAMARLQGLRPPETDSISPVPACPSTTGRAMMIPGTVRSSTVLVRPHGAQRDEGDTGRLS
jgi:hypothetical protein